MSRTPAQLREESAQFQKWHKRTDDAIDDVVFAAQPGTALNVDLTEVPERMRPRLKMLYDKAKFDTTSLQNGALLRISWAPTSALRGQPVTQVVEAEPSPRADIVATPPPRGEPGRPRKRAASTEREPPIAKRTRREAVPAVRVLAVENWRAPGVAASLEFAVRYDDEDRDTPLWQPWQNLCEWQAEARRWLMTVQLAKYLKTTPAAATALGQLLRTEQPTAALPWAASSSKTCSYTNEKGVACGAPADQVAQGVPYCAAHTCKRCGRRKMQNGKQRCSRCHHAPTADEEEEEGSGVV